MPVVIIYSPVRIIHAVSPSSKRKSCFRNITTEKTTKIISPKVGRDRNLCLGILSYQDLWKSAWGRSQVCFKGVFLALLL